MATKSNRAIGSWWIFMLVVTLDTISIHRVEGLRALDKNNFGPKPKGTIKTIEVPEDGDLIDCVDFYKQPAFDNPLIKDSKMEPSASFLRLFNNTNERWPKLIQNWHKYGKCPKGTVPIRRPWNINGIIHRKTPNVQSPSNREYAIAFQRGSTYHGAGAAFNIWNPRVTVTNEFSLSQLWVASKRGTPLNTIEAGWIVSPSHYNDSQTRLFIYWTRDDYNRTGCYNVECRGFVQTDTSIVLGGAITTISVYGGQTEQIFINVARDPETKDWWLQVGNKRVGKFPNGLFTSLTDGADYDVEFGGEIINRRVLNRHTGTHMGSGHRPREGFGKANFICNILVVNDRYEIVDASLERFVTRPECYSLLFGAPETENGSHFFFGGAGYSQMCQ